MPGWRGLEVTGQRNGEPAAVLRCRIAGELSTLRVSRGARNVTRWSGTRSRAGAIVHVCVAPLPVPGVCSCVALGRERSSRAARSLRGRQCWALTGMVVQHLTVARIPRPWTCPRRAGNTAVLGEGQRLLINDPVGSTACVITAWMSRGHPLRRQIRHRYLERDAIRDRSGLRLLDMVPGRSKQVFKNLASLPARHVARKY